MEQHIRSALRGDTDTVIGILEEAVLWLENQGMPMWRTEERDPGQIALDIEAGLFQLVEYEGQPPARPVCVCASSRRSATVCWQGYLVGYTTMGSIKGACDGKAVSSA
jgi:hypothetical protein